MLTSFAGADSARNAEVDALFPVTPVLQVLVKGI
jgi:hypothetical protein